MIKKNVFLSSVICLSTHKSSSTEPLNDWNQTWHTCSFYCLYQLWVTSIATTQPNSLFWLVEISIFKQQLTPNIVGMFILTYNVLWLRFLLVDQYGHQHSTYLCPLKKFYREYAGFKVLSVGLSVCLIWCRTFLF